MMAIFLIELIFISLNIALICCWGEKPKTHKPFFLILSSLVNEKIGISLFISFLIAKA